MKSDPKIKLTLSVKKSVVDIAKKYATEHETSISRMVEEHLSSYHKSKEKENSRKVSIADQLFGFAAGPLSNMTDDELRDLYIKDKYGL